MASPKKTAKKALDPAAGGQKEQFNVRVDPDLRDKLDGWLNELNDGRRLRLKRSDLVRGVLDWAVENRPDFERTTAGAKPPGGARVVHGFANAARRLGLHTEPLRTTTYVPRYPNLQLVLDEFGDALLPETIAAAERMAAHHDGDLAPADWREQVLEMDRRFRKGEPLGAPVRDDDDTPKFGREG